MNKIDKSIALFNEAKALMPGGVNSPVRAFKNIHGNPIFFEKAQGAYLFDADGNKYIDYVGLLRHGSRMWSLLAGCRRGERHLQPHAYGQCK